MTILQIYMFYDMGATSTTATIVGMFSFGYFFLLRPFSLIRQISSRSVHTLRTCSFEQKLSRLARKHFDKFRSEISPCNKISRNSYISFIWDEKFSRVPRSRLLTGEISVIEIIFVPYEHNIIKTFSLNGKAVIVSFVTAGNFSR